MGSPVVPLRSTSKMNFKFLLAVFVVAVALMPTAHSQWPNRGNLAAQLLAASCRFGICLTTTSPDSPGCPTGWVKQFGRCYQFSTQEKTWDEAKEHCRSNEVVTTNTEQRLGPGQMGLPGTINIGSTNNHLPTRHPSKMVPTCAEVFKYSELLTCHLVRTEKNSSARKEQPNFLLETVASAVSVQVAQRVGKVCLTVVSNGSTLQ